MAVRIRLKRFGRTHRPFYRVCAIDRQTPRDGRVLEELGTYDTSVANTDARAILKKERIDYWLSVGARPSDKVGVLIKKYGSGGTHLEQQQQALHKLALPKPIADPGPPPRYRKNRRAPSEAGRAQQTPAEPPPQDEAAESPEEASTPPPARGGWRPKRRLSRLMISCWSQRITDV